MKKLTLLTSLFCFIIVAGCKKEEAKKTITRAELISKYHNAIKQIDSLKKISHLTLAKTMRNGKKSDNNGEGVPVDFIMSEEEAYQIINPLIEPTVNYMSAEYGINLYDDFFIGDVRIATIGSAVLRIENLELENKTIVVDGDTSGPDGVNWLAGYLTQKYDYSLTTNYSGIKYSYEFMTMRRDMYDCALRAIGVEAIVHLIQDGITSLGKTWYKNKAVRKAVTKVATRAFGVLGAVAAMIEFVDCLNEL